MFLFRRQLVVSLLAFVTGGGRDRPSLSSYTAVQAVTVDSSSSSAPPSSSVPCRSNATHIAWSSKTETTKLSTMATLPVFGRRKAQTTVTKTTTITTTSSSQSSCCCTYQTRIEAEQDCLKYLQQNLMDFDRPFAETMGFPTTTTKNEINNSEATTDDYTTDGLDNGLIGPTISLALDSKVLYPWTDLLPKDMFQNYVLNYANFNEARTNWRPLLVDALRFNESQIFQEVLLGTKYNSNYTTTATATTTTTEQQEQDWDSIISSIVTWVNQVLWTKLGRHDGHPIYFKSSQTPLIFDPMSTIAFGYASCTGTSILFSNALRSVGIASRVVGTPAWYGNSTQGNHNWVEVYLPQHTPGNWKFLEPSPALPHVDTLEENPCHRWFCTADRYPSSKVYAAHYTKADVITSNDDDDDGEWTTTATSTHVPLPWEWNCKDVPGVDRTQYYVDVCGLCDE